MKKVELLRKNPVRELAPQESARPTSRRPLRLRGEFFDPRIGRRRPSPKAIDIGTMATPQDLRAKWLSCSCDSLLLGNKKGQSHRGLRPFKDFRPQTQRILAPFLLAIRRLNKSAVGVNNVGLVAGRLKRASYHWRVRKVLGSNGGCGSRTVR